MIDENLRPGTGSQANDQDAARLWVNSAERECTDDEICIVGGIDQKRAIVNAAAKNRAVRKNRYDAIAILDDLCERLPGLWPTRERSTKIGISLPATAATRGGRKGEIAPESSSNEAISQRI